MNTFEQMSRSVVWSITGMVTRILERAMHEAAAIYLPQQRNR
jgi:hypothetical protein